MSASGSLAAVLAAAGLPTDGRYEAKGGWVSRAWVGTSYVVRVGDAAAAHAYEHEASVVASLAGTDVPHARHIAHGTSAEGAWYVSARLPGRTLHDTWPTASVAERRSIIHSLGDALRALHHVPVPDGLMPPWLRGALAGGSWPAYHPPFVRVAMALVEDAAAAGLSSPLLGAVRSWVSSRLPLFDADPYVLVHGDLHGSNIMVDEGRVTGLIDFAEAVAQPADVELDTILRWCARPEEFPPTPTSRGLDAASLTPVRGWLEEAYPELFARPSMGSRLAFYDLWVELAIFGHHPDAAVRAVAEERIVRTISEAAR
ncbi:phosphotransferase family protein [Curtobacterium sp. PhB115]|uniref:phosphotransferase family protein n=1 Tax=Curtobacterium sp. PhB115 TaxID=2485173 RepID=UPI000FC14FE1|nr:phosphotransferase [Curtobacterium sp. PhB115]ROP61488.1 aminoglycoside phosphotransferase (APT) family kinase protein [Curtobacterium sp. PhB115]